MNPASINGEMHNQLALNYVNYLGDVNYGSAAYAYTWDTRVQTLHAGVTYINYGSFDGADEFGNPLEKFSGSEVAVSLGYARNLPNTDFHIGTNVKIISSRLDSYNSLGAAADIGFFYRNEAIRFNAALTVRNVGFQFSTYAGVREELPLDIILGISQELQHVPLRWHLTFDNLHNWDIAFANPNRTQGTLDGGSQEERISFLDEILRHTSIGAEIFPEGGFSMRFGYNFRRGEELKILEQRNFSGISAGFGVKINKLRFHYTYARYTAAANSSFLGLMVNF